MKKLFVQATPSVYLRVQLCSCPRSLREKHSHVCPRAETDALNKDNKVKNKGNKKTKDARHGKGVTDTLGHAESAPHYRRADTPCLSVVPRCGGGRALAHLLSLCV